MEIIPLGDSTLIVRVCDDFDRDPKEASSAVLNALRQLETARIPGVIELTSAYTTVSAFFDPLRIVAERVATDGVFDWLAGRIYKAVETAAPVPARRRARTSAPGYRSRVVEIPVCYDAEFALDLEEVARHANRSTDDVVVLHTAADYRVQCIGFTPGFPFLSGLPSELATPRRATPRKGIPAGSVAIGGGQTGIYPLRSPGGWNVIGRTPLAIFDFKREPPALLRAGDRVRFRAVTREEFQMLQA
jgi:KipI family sensor histidine kinase inhibitor